MHEKHPLGDVKGMSRSDRGSGRADGAVARLEPNDTVRCAHNDGARTIAHNPRRRGDEALLVSPTRKAKNGSFDPFLHLFNNY